MRRRKPWLGGAALLLAALALGGCASGGDRLPAAGSDIGTLELRFSTEPAKLTGSGSSTLSLDVKQGSEPVKGASVVFEIWPKGEQQHAQLSAKSEEDGKYYVRGEFSQAGDYYLLAHVTTAEGLHDMKTFEFSVHS
ncbi:FixH family protein [Cohnella sp.]|uniref:FixH family protein n=1 Tax=Cohnella sp. TaxID=1883426 RepID=UPI0035612F6B